MSRSDLSTKAVVAPILYHWLTTVVMIALWNGALSQTCRLSEYVNIFVFKKLVMFILQFIICYAKYDVINTQVCCWGNKEILVSKFFSFFSLFFFFLFFLDQQIHNHFFSMSIETNLTNTSVMAKHSDILSAEVKNLIFLFYPIFLASHGPGFITNILKRRNNTIDPYFC